MTLKELKNKYTTTNIRQGRPITQTLSTELDSTTIVIPLSEKLDICAYDIVELTNEASTKEYWCVADFQEEYATYESPYKFNYTIQLMSLTKLLETMFLPNMTITNIGQNRTLLYYINNALNLYFKSDYNFNITIHSNITTATTNEVAKEYTFQEPTLREYLDTLLGQVGSIVTLNITTQNNNYIFVLNLLNLNATSGTMPTDYIKSIVSVQDSNNYISNILHTTDDVISTDTMFEYLQETSTDPVVNTETAQLNLSRKAYDFKSLSALNISFTVKQYAATYFGATYQNTSTTYSQSFGLNLVDISDFVKTKEEYSTLSYPKKSAYKLPDGTYDSKVYYTLTSKQHITNTLTWDRDTNSITNLHTYKKFSDWWSNYDTNTSIENALRRAIWEWFKVSYSGAGSYVTAGDQPDDEYGVWRDPDDLASNKKIYWSIKIEGYDYREQLFGVVYQPYISPKIAEIDFSKRHLINTVDADTNAKINVLMQLDKSKEKIKQSGLVDKIMTAYIRNTPSTYFNTYKLGQVWYDENNIKHVLTTLEKTAGPSGISVKGTLSPNYSNTILNTQINREKRYYAYANTDIVTRKEIIHKKWKLTLSDTLNTGGIVTPSDYCYINFGYKSGSDDKYLVPTTMIYNDRTCVFEIQTKDNVAIAITKSQDSDASIGGLPSQILKYVDDDGEFNSVSFNFGTIIALDYNDTEPVIDGKTAREWAANIDVNECYHTETDEDNNDTIVYDIDQLLDDDMETVTYTMLKDNRESMHFSVQYSVECVNATSNDDVEIEFNLQKYLDDYKIAKNAVNQTFTYLLLDANGNLYTSGFVNYDAVFTTNYWIGASMTFKLVIYRQQSNLDKFLTITNYRGGYINPSIEDLTQ